MIYVVGSINLDYTVIVDRLPRPGETVTGASLTISPGGKGANQALAARRAGASVAMVGAVGSDAAARHATELLARDGVDMSTYLKHVERGTGSAVIMVDHRGENCIAIVAGANSELTAADVETALANLAPGDVLLLQQEIPASAIRCALESARATGAISILNIAPVQPESRQLAEMADIVIANETEYSESFEADGDDFIKSATQWTLMTKRDLIITLGSEGAILVNGMDGSNVVVRPPRIDAIDTVGAGDTFCGYLAAGLALGQTKEDALRNAVIAGALACVGRGAQDPMPFSADVLAMKSRLQPR